MRHVCKRVEKTVSPSESRYVLQAKKKVCPKHDHMLKRGGCHLLSHTTQSGPSKCARFSVKSPKSKAVSWEQNVPGWSQLCSA